MTFILLLLLLVLLLVFVSINDGGPSVFDCMMETGLLFAFIFMLPASLQLDIFNLRLIQSVNLVLTQSERTFAAVYDLWQALTWCRV